jgi:uncharacterized protein YbaR (Trm112 family)
MTSVVLSLNLIRFLSDPDSLHVIECPGCGDSLTVHQPDENLPDRLLGTCPDCRTWFLIDGATEVMVKLPDESILRDS